MERLFGYRSDTNEYCGRIHIRLMIFIALGLMVVTQMFLNIWYLSIHVWWYFIPFGVVIAASLLLFLAIRQRNAQYIQLLMLYQLVMTALFIATVINLIIIICHPYSNTYLYNHVLHIKGKKDFKPSVKDVAKHVRIVAIAYAPVYLLFTVVNIFILGVLWNYSKYLTETGPIRTTNARETNRQVSSPAGNRPASPPTAAKPETTTSSGGTGVTFTTTTATTPSGFGGGASPGVYTSSTPYSYNYNNQTATFDNNSRQQSSFATAQNIGYTSATLAAPTARAAMTPNWDEQPSFQAPQYYQGDRNQPPPVPPHPNANPYYSSSDQQYY